MTNFPDTPATRAALDPKRTIEKRCRLAASVIEVNLTAGDEVGDAGNAFLLAFARALHAEGRAAGLEEAVQIVVDYPGAASGHEYEAFVTGRIAHQIRHAITRPAAPSTGEED